MSTAHPRRVLQSALLFGAGLLMWPVVFGVGGIHRVYGYLSRPLLDYIELFAGALGLLLCATAPFVIDCRPAAKCALLAGALFIYAADLFVSCILGMMIFGIPID